MKESFECDVRPQEPWSSRGPRRAPWKCSSKEQIVVFARRVGQWLGANFVFLYAPPGRLDLARETEFWFPLLHVGIGFW